MEYEETDSDDDSKLQIVEAGSPSLRMEDGGMSSKATLIPRTLMRSLSAVESMKEDYHMGGGLASDAVESLLLLVLIPNWRKPRIGSKCWFLKSTVDWGEPASF